MKTFEFQGHEIVADKVVAVGPVAADAELGCLAFTVFLAGGAELTFREMKSSGYNRESFLGLLRQSL